MVADALSRRYVLLNTLNSKLLGFEYIKELSLDENDFGSIYDECKVSTNDRFFRHDEFLFKENKLCVPNYSMRELLVREVHRGGLMGHFGIAKTVDVLRKHFYWPNMKRDVQRICDKCITSKYRVMTHGLRAIIQKNLKNWENYLPFIEFAYNRSDQLLIIQHLRLFKGLIL